MKFPIVTFCFLLLAISVSVSAQKYKAPADILYAGTSPGNGSKGIYVLHFDRQAHTLEELQTVDEKKNPSFLAVHPDKKYLYAIYAEGSSADDKMGTIMSFRIDQKTGLLTKLNEQSTNGRSPSHVSVDPSGRFVYVANYGAGNFAIFPLRADGSIAEAIQVRQYEAAGFDTALQKHPFVHSVIPSSDGKFIYVSALGLDKIMVFHVSKKGDFLPAKSPFVSSTPGSGPRHLIIHPNGRFAFSVEEITATIASYKRDKITGALVPFERFEMVPKEFTQRTSGADLHLSPDSKFLYVAVRGLNVIAIYAVDPKTGKLTFVAREDTHGDHPRNFCVDKAGQYVFVENMKSDNIAVFKRDAGTGKMTYLEDKKIPKVACMIQL
jgi:6-phosphogluconolactonase